MSRDRPPNPPKRDGDVPEDERGLFERAMQGVRPLAGPKRVALTPAETPVERRHPFAPALNDGPLLAVETWGEHGQGIAPGVHRDRLRELARGNPRPEAMLDLHGLDAEKAGQALTAFIQSAVGSQRRSVLVIHGRGLRSGAAGPILRTLVFERLSHHPLGRHVLAFSQPPAALGGVGATIVLLRRA